MKQTNQGYRPRLMVASSIHGFEDQLEQVCYSLYTYGYEVWNSHIKTIPVHPGLSNAENCLKAVEQCDLFFGIIRQRYGTAMAGDISITHLEMRTAILLKKPRWFIAHRDVAVAKHLLLQYMFDDAGELVQDFCFKATSVLDDVRIISQYNDTIMNKAPVNERNAHWVDEYFRMGDILTCIETQFSDVQRVRDIIDQMKQL